MITGQGSGQYVVAGVDTFVDLVSKFIDKHDKDNHFDDKRWSDFLQHTISKYLFSYGTGLSYKTKKISQNHSQKIAKTVKKIIGRKFMDGTELYIDSGGFQVASGRIELERIWSTLLQVCLTAGPHSRQLGLSTPSGPSNSRTLPRRAIETA